MGDLFNFSNPVLTFFNSTIILTFLLILMVGYKLSSLIEFFKECEEYNNEIYNKKETPNNKEDDDFEPFFTYDSAYTKEKYVGDIFNEYAKQYSEKKKEEKSADDIIRTRTETFPKCYKTLGFSKRPESPDEIKKKYRDLAKKLHPDLGGSEDFFVQLNKAYKEALEVWKKEEHKL